MLWRIIVRSWKVSVILFLCSIAMTFLISLGRNWSNSVLAKVSLFTALIWLMLWIGNSYLNEYMSQKISWTAEPVKRLIYGTIGMLAFTVGSVYFLVYVFKWVFNINMGSNLGGTIYTSILITTVITMFMTGRSFLLNWRQAAVDSERLQRESVKAQYEALKSQVNPHFLFNSLNALTNLVYEDQDKAARFIKQLSEVYRYVLDTRSKELVSITEEVRFAKAYTYLQEIRFGDNLKIHFELPETDGYVAPLAIQILIENAIKHNIISKESPLKVQVVKENDWLRVENNLQRKTLPESDSPGIGLVNIRNRYKFLTEKEVRVEESPNSFGVLLPIIAPE